MASIDISPEDPNALEANEPPPEKARKPEPSWQLRAKEIASIVLSTVLKFLGSLVAIVFTLTAGIWTSNTMVETGSRLSTETFGPWKHWSLIGQTGADPYSRAHLAKSGTIMIASDSAGTFEARVDGEGARLHSSCNYIVEGPSPKGLWWSLAVFNATGDLIENDAKRYVFTSDTIAPNPDGSYIVSLGREARPGNWLPTGGAGRVVLVFTLLDPPTGFSDEERTERPKLLPKILREGCS